MKTLSLNTFIFQDKLYIRVIPVKNLMKSNLIYEVCMRGDIFAFEVATGKLTVIPGKSEVEFREANLELLPIQPSLFPDAEPKQEHPL